MSEEPSSSTTNFTYNLTHYNNSEEEIAHNYLYHNRIIIEHLYKYYIPPMLVFCLASIFINIRVLVSAYWIRRPISPTLYISLSLAASDACTSALLGIGLLFNSYLPVVYEIRIPSCMVLITIEMYRLSGVIITVVHLLALSINHYLGILKPLRYLSIMTTKKITVTVVLLWIVPIAFMKVYFFWAGESDFWTDGCQTDSFLSEVKFRLVFSSLFFIPLTIMAFCYTHILFLVRKQQDIWAQLSRSGSTRYRGIRSRSGVDSQRQLEGNVKAIYTTLLILGSCIIGWLPAVMIYIMICPKGCFYDGEELERARFYNIELSFYIAWVTNLLIILKTLVNPIIYSCRMVEIKESTRRMHAAFNQTWRASQRTEERFLSESQRSQNTFGGGGGGGSGRVATALCRLNGNGSNRSQPGQPELANTLV